MVAGGALATADGLGDLNTRVVATRLDRVFLDRRENAEGHSEYAVGRNVRSA
jgi:hypothetical protein